MSQNAAIWAYSLGAIGAIPGTIANVSDRNYYIRKKNKEYDSRLNDFVEEGLKRVK